MIESGLDTRVLVTEIEDRDATVLLLRDPRLSFEEADELKPRLKSTLSEAMDRGRSRFVLNLANVGVMDSCGLAVLISLKKLAESRGGRLLLSNPSAMIQRLLALTRLDRAFDIYATEAEAVGDL